MENSEGGLVRRNEERSVSNSQRPKPILTKVGEGQKPLPSRRNAGYIPPDQAKGRIPNTHSRQGFSNRAGVQKALHHNQGDHNYVMICYMVFWLALIFGLIRFVGFCGYGSAWVTKVTDYQAGFGVGLAHGLLSVIALMISFFNKGVSVYEIRNTGPGYNTGFIIGLCLWIYSGRFYTKRVKR